MPRKGRKGPRRGGRAGRRRPYLGIAVHKSGLDDVVLAEQPDTTSGCIARADPAGHCELRHISQQNLADAYIIISAVKLEHSAATRRPGNPHGAAVCRAVVAVIGRVVGIAFKLIPAYKTGVCSRADAAQAQGQNKRQHATGQIYLFAKHRKDLLTKSVLIRCSLYSPSAQASHMRPD